MRLPNRIVEPPGGWRYREKHTGYVFPRQANFDELVREVTKYCKLKEVPLPSEEEIEHDLCKHLPPRYCEGDDRPVEGLQEAWEFTIGTVMQGTATLFDWFFRSGGKRVSAHLAEERAKVCASNECGQLKPISGCKSCAAHPLYGLVNKLVGGSVPQDDLLGGQGCAKCGCSAKAKIWLPLDVLSRHTSVEMPECCWMVQEEKANERGENRKREPSQGTGGTTDPGVGETQQQERHDQGDVRREPSV